MPMAPRGNENKDGFIGRCISYEMDKGHPQDQAIAMCYSKWRESKKAVVTSVIAKLAKSVKSMDVSAMKSEDADQAALVAEKAVSLAQQARKTLEKGPQVDLVREIELGAEHEMQKGLKWKEATYKAFDNLSRDPLFYASIRQWARKQRLAGQAGAVIDEETEPEYADEERESGVLDKAATTESHGALIPEKLDEEITDTTQDRKK